MKIVVYVIVGSDMDNELTVFLLQHKMKFTRLPDLPQTDVSGRSEQLPNFQKFKEAVKQFRSNFTQQELDMMFGGNCHSTI